MAAPPLLRARVSARTIPLALGHHKRAIELEMPSSGSRISPSKRRVSCISRLLLDSRGLMSMLPLHSAIASARLRSSLSMESQSWGWIPQGISMPL